MSNTPKMKNAEKKISVIALIAVVLISNLSFAQMKMKETKNVSVTNTTVFKAEMRKLWEDHVTWTRNVILCLVDELPGKDQAVNRLLKNQDHIGDAIKPYYGEASGKKLTELLYSHINISAEVVISAKSENTTALEDANKRWSANSNEISEFLCNANPFWKLSEMKMMMSDHLKLTTDEAMQRIKKDYDADVVAYDKVHDEILKMADMLSDGIVKQFPEKFTTTMTKKLAAK